MVLSKYTPTHIHASIHTYIQRQTVSHTHLSIKSTDYTHTIYEDKLHHRHITIFWGMTLCSLVDMV